MEWTLISEETHGETRITARTRSVGKPDKYELEFIIESPDRITNVRIYVGNRRLGIFILSATSKPMISIARRRIWYYGYFDSFLKKRQLVEAKCRTSLKDTINEILNELSSILSKSVSTNHL